LEPIYCWSNTLDGSLTNMSSSYPGIQSGRDFYNGTPQPGYTPFIYPHPLDWSVGWPAAGAGASRGTTYKKNLLLGALHIALQICVQRCS
jgi:hypothetical protein